MLDAKPHWLANDAPYGEYRVDFVAMELFYRGAAPSTHGEDEFVRLVREHVRLAARYAVMSARVHLVQRPKNRHQAQRLFKDLLEIQSRIERNKGLDPTELVISTIPNLNSPRREGPTRLQTVLQLAHIEIRQYLQSYRVASEAGNHDWLTQRFIDELFEEIWCRYVRVDLYDEAQVFNKLLAAAWQDVQFPTQEEDGRRLEDWLADRVRKHFSDGIVSSRRQELDLELAKERRRVPGPGE